MYAQILRKAVIKSNKTLKEISKECARIGVRVAPSYISKLQNGHRKPPREKVSVAIARSLDIHPGELLKSTWEERLNANITSFLL